jgi:cold shock protein
VDFVKINVDENPIVPSRYGVRSIPTLMLFKSGKVVATKIGTLPPARLQSWLNEHLLLNASAAMRGKVKWFHAKKGYGFITPDRNSKDIFVHISEVQKAGLSGLEEGAVVEFELNVGKNGHEAAINIKKSV